MREIFFLSCGGFVAPGLVMRPLGPEALKASWLSNTVGVAVRDNGDIVLVDAGWDGETCASPARTWGTRERPPSDSGSARRTPSHRSCGRWARSLEGSRHRGDPPALRSRGRSPGLPERRGRRLAARAQGVLGRPARQPLSCARPGPRRSHPRRGPRRHALRTASRAAPTRSARGTWSCSTRRATRPATSPWPFEVREARSCTWATPCTRAGSSVCRRRGLACWPAGSRGVARR